MTEAEKLRDFSLTLLEFIYGRREGGNPGIHNMAIVGIQAAFAEGNLRGLRLAAKDYAQLVRGLPASELAPLNELLRARVGYTLDKEEDARVQLLAKVLARGRIVNDDEYRLFMARMDDIYSDDATRDEQTRINRLLGDYDRAPSKK